MIDDKIKFKKNMVSSSSILRDEQRTTVSQPASPAFDISRYTLSQLHQQVKENKAMCLDMEERMFQKIWNYDENTNDMEMNRHKKNMYQCRRCNIEFEHIGAYNFHVFNRNACKRKKANNHVCYICVQVYGSHTNFCYHEYNGLEKPKRLNSSSRNQRPKEILPVIGVNNSAQTRISPSMKLDGNTGLDNEIENGGCEMKSVPKVIKESNKKRNQEEVIFEDIGCIGFDQKAVPLSTKTSFESFIVKRATKSFHIKTSGEKRLKGGKGTIQVSKSELHMTDKPTDNDICDSSLNTDEKTNIKGGSDQSGEYQTPRRYIIKEECDVFDI